MSKIYEALMNSRRELIALDTSGVRSFEQNRVKTKFKIEMEKEIIGLFNSVDPLLGNAKGKIIQFIGPAEKEGASTVAREFAMVSSFTFGKSVLLLDADQRKPSQHLFFGITPALGWTEVIGDGRPAAAAFYRVNNTCLFVSPPAAKPTDLCRIFCAGGLSSMWDEVRGRFDFIVIDSPPPTPSFDSTGLASGTDGVILVLGAETISQPLAEKIKDRIIKNGGNLLGVVFNRRKYHIPEFIYKRL